MAETRPSHAPREIKAPGRPRLADTDALRSTVTVAVPTPLHDALIQEAQQRGLAVSQYVRTLITRRR